ncbi:sugar transferase [Limobrevibacterium gyesilva]|uniref:Sugar transferase n=1 Tax=Limobrevibacterium gyesilva TaxID=2991712 RepID=A0AA41YKD1_9PROT|nr:sugar transferase [Limobrevibacterium gyesilva]MCW3475409.1 sugar transferase [Limobrevibacterium gyesilva]
MSNRKMTRDAIPAAALFAGSYIPASVAGTKRALDIFAALVLLLVTAPLWPLIALAIKLDSRGPVIYRQMRVGRAMADRTELFMILKFRSMRADAEARSGAVWASRRDPRITRVGSVLRKTRLDEIPQLVNVLRGDMSLIGPRPERPAFYRRLERIAPFFADRTVGLRPGITGLAQVRQGYDSCDADVVRKVGFDAAYAMRLSDFRIWVVSDISIILRTCIVMVSGRGQ